MAEALSATFERLYLFLMIYRDYDSRRVLVSRISLLRQFFSSLEYLCHSSCLTYISILSDKVVTVRFIENYFKKLAHSSPYLSLADLTTPSTS